ncbi:hypothetical protein TWF481_008794 [Arthrobotrys musiformis]|uniref:NACHT domain-containing protein n=1 Tax=Arthrobotrys musiformis TaxID=47236 RepID=A0AAV9WDZ7_9PEZI
MSARTTLESPDLYTIGWIAALPIERASATALLDERHDEPNGFSQNQRDTNSYTWGRMGKHNIVIASLPAGLYGTTSAATTALNLLSSLPDIRIGLLVGIGGGIARPEDDYDIRLGDVVVGQPEGSTGGVVQYDLRKGTPRGGYERKDFLNMPPSVLLNALSNLQSEHYRLESRIPQMLKEMWRSNPKMKSPKPGRGFYHQGAENDRLFRSSSIHNKGRDCRSCDNDQEIKREVRGSTDPEIHYGIIASGNTLVKDAATRDDILERVGEQCLCVEMEAAGLMNYFPCLVIRGICDYADSHKNDRWQCYASATAAAFGKELLEYIPVKGLQETRRAVEILESIEEKVQGIHSTTKDTNTTVHDVLHTVRSDRDHKILDWLSSLTSQEKQTDVLSQHQSGTGQHLLSSKMFRDWLDGNHRILWCVGSPGTGKTVLASIVIDAISNREISASQESKAGIAFLYCTYAERNIQTIERLVGSIVRQLIVQLQCIDIPLSVLELYNQHKRSKTHPSTNELSKELCSLVFRFPKVYIIVDALDECDDTNKTRSLLLSQLQRLAPHVQLFFTSRPLENIQLDAIQFKVTAQEDDMRKYLSAMIKDEPLLTKFCADYEGLEDEILKRIVKKANGLFLLAKLHFKSVAEELRAMTVMRALVTLPEGLTETYNDALRRIQDGQPKRRSQLAMKVLMLLSYALRPLELCEVQHALLAMEMEEGEHRLGLRPEDGTGINPNDLYDKELLFTVCVGIVTLEDETSMVRFIHETAERYFERMRIKLFPDAQTKLAAACIRYLSFPEFRVRSCQTAKEFLAYIYGQGAKFYAYAARSWGHYARNAPTLTKRIIDFLESQEDMEGARQVLFIMIFSEVHAIAIGKGGTVYGNIISSILLEIDERAPSRLTGLHLAALLGLTKVVEGLLEDLNDPDPKDIRGLTPLWLAAYSGHADTVKTLTDTGKADPGVCSPSRQVGLGLTPFFHATAQGHQAVCEVMLNTGKVDPNQKHPARFSIDTPRKCFRTSLAIASEKGDAAIVEILLKNGADSDLGDGDGRVPILLAAQNGHADVVKLLVKGKCNINAQDQYDGARRFKFGSFWFDDQKPRLEGRDGLSVIHWAATAEGDQVGIVKCLFDNGADILRASQWGANALSLAVIRGHTEIVKFLIDRGAADLEARMGKWTVLHIAAAHRNAEMIQILLDNGVKVNAKADDGMTPLSMAVIGRERYSSICSYSEDLPGRDWVKELLASTDDTENPGRTLNVINLLHRYDAELDAKDVHGLTAFYYATECGATNIAQHLLELGANAHASDLVAPATPDPDDLEACYDLLIAQSARNMENAKKLLRILEHEQHYM